MSLFDNLKNIFPLSKIKIQKLKLLKAFARIAGKARMGRSFYKKLKANNITPEHNTYNSFIHEVAEKLDKITLKEDTYTCETCNVKYEK